MKLLPLTQGKFAEVDDEDFDWLDQWKWQAQPKRRGGKKSSPIVNYIAQRSVFVGINPKTKKRKTQNISLAKEILGISENKQLLPQHIDGDGLNCQKSNLGVVTRPQIYQGITGHKKTSNETSSYIGVHSLFNKTKTHINKYWVGSIVFKGKKQKKIFPFTPEGEIQAAKWYDAMAIKLHEDFARLKLNFPKKEYGGNLTTFVYEIGGL